MPRTARQDKSAAPLVKHPPAQITNLRMLQSWYVHEYPGGINENSFVALGSPILAHNRVLLQQNCIHYIVRSDTNERVFFWNFLDCNDFEPDTPHIEQWRRTCVQTFA